MKSRLFLSLTIVALLGLVAGCTPNTQSQKGGPEKSSPTRQVWEYKQIQVFRSIGAEKSNGYQYADASSWAEDGGKDLPLPVDTVAKMKELGEQGWELVSGTPLAGVAAPQGSYAGFTDVVVYWFKRPK